MILIDAHPRNDWLVRAVERRLREELAKLRVEINEDKSRMVDLKKKGGSFTFLGFEISPHSESHGEVATERSAQAEEADSAARQAPGNLP